jgi:DNA-binding NarL/FixJ family response regulator
VVRKLFFKSLLAVPFVARDQLLGVALVSAPPLKPITVLVVDDDPAVRDGLMALLETQPDLLPVGEAADGLEAIEMAAGLRPDVVLMDLGMPHLDGLEATRPIKERYPETRVIVLNLYGTR